MIYRLLYLYCPLYLSHQISFSFSNCCRVFTIVHYSRIRRQLPSRLHNLSSLSLTHTFKSVPKNSLALCTALCLHACRARGVKQVLAQSCKKYIQPAISHQTKGHKFQYKYNPAKQVLAHKSCIRNSNNTNNSSSPYQIQTHPTIKIFFISI